MKINQTHYNNLYNPNFQEHRLSYCRDVDDYRLKSILFDSATTLERAISEISSDKTIIKMFGEYKYFVNKILAQIKKDLSINNDLSNLKVKGMIDYGQTAFVFETENEGILKITSRDHFLGRKAESFDIPIKQQGKLAPHSFCYYYLEDKTSNLDKHNEMEQIVNKIKKMGFKVADCEMRQFGKTKNGQIFLIDPECARKSGMFGFLKQKFVKIKSYIQIMR